MKGIYSSSNYMVREKYTMNITKIIVAICSLLFLMVGADKFFSFMEPPCSLEDHIPSLIWKVVGVLQIVAGILIWMPKYRKFVAGFFFIFMLVITVVHLTQSTYDIGGSIFMAILLGLLVWNPAFINGKRKSE